MNEQDRLILLAIMYISGFAVTLMFGYMAISRKFVEEDIAPGYQPGYYTVTWIISVIWPLSWIAMGVIFIIELIHYGLIKLTGG